MSSKKVYKTVGAEQTSFSEYFDLVFDRLRHDWQKMPPAEVADHKFRYRHRIRHA